MVAEILFPLFFKKEKIIVDSPTEPASNIFLKMEVVARVRSNKKS